MRERLTVKQRALLERLPDLPSDGRRCAGGKKRTAESLVEIGYAQLQGVCDTGGVERYYYVRSADGRRHLNAARGEEPSE